MNAGLVKVCNWILANKLALTDTTYLQNSISSNLRQKKTVTTTNQLYMFNSETCRKQKTKFPFLVTDDKLS